MNATDSDRDQADDSDLGPAVPRHLERAPITEALVDFRVQLREGFSLSEFEPLIRRQAQGYPGRGAVKTFTAKVGLGSAGPRQDVEHGEVGVLVRAADDKSVAQFRINGFTFNRLEPYTSWEAIFPETMRLWREYVSVAQPSLVTRLATRYINRLKLPLPIMDLRDYLTEPPRIPSGLPQTLKAYLIRLVVHDAEQAQSAIVTQSFEPDPTNTEQANILLDIDAFSERNVRPSDDGEIVRVLTGLHDFKNELFFRNITQRASELFE